MRPVPLALLLAVVTARCDCGSATVGRDVGRLVMLDTGNGSVDAAADARLDDGPRSEAGRDGGAPDAAPRDIGSVDSHGGPDAAAATDVATATDSARADSAATETAVLDVTGGPDASVAADVRLPDSASGDAGGCASTCVPLAGECHVCVDVLIDNFCHTEVAPAEIDVPADTTLTLTFVNRSVDYAADVWSSRGYGYVGLPTGATWEDPIWHCTGPDPYVEYFDVSIEGGGSVCPGVRLNLNCQ